jgi:hypothetical protein
MSDSSDSPVDAFKTINVVKITSNGPRKTTLNSTQYITNSCGQITLPNNFYSAGYYGRITDANWSDLEDLQDSDKDPVEK